MKAFKLFFLMVPLIISGIFFHYNWLSQPSQKIKIIAISQIVEHPSLEAVRRGIFDFLVQSNLQEGKDYKIIYKNAQGNMSINNQIAQQFIGIKPDVIVAISTPSAQALTVASHNMNIPFVFAAVTDPVHANLVKDLNRPGKFISGVSDLPPVEAQITLIKDLLPKLSKVGILYNPAEVNSVKIVNQFKQLAKKANLEVFLAPTTRTSEVLFAAQSLVGKVEAIYVPQDNTIVSAISSLISLQYEKKIPCFTSDEVLVQKGAFAAVGTSYYEHGKQVGERIVKFLNHSTGLEIPIAFPEKPQIYINKTTAKHLDINISDKIAKKAHYYKLQK